MNDRPEQPISSTIPAAKTRDYSHAWRALRHRNFRLFFAGQSLSLIGSWMTRLAAAWLVYRLTKSPLALGAIGFAGQIPNFLLAPLAGVIVDRCDRRTLLLWTQALAMSQSALLAILALTRVINIYEIFVISILQGVITTFDLPGRQSFMVRMVGSREDLSNASAINSSMVNSARLIGPALAGLLVAATSEGWCFLVDAVSYLAVLASLLLMRMPVAEVEEKEAPASMTTQMREGWAYISGSLPIRSILMLFAVISLMGWPFAVLMPIFAAQVLHGGPNTLGFLMGALGVGALASALGMVLRRSVRGLVGQLPLGSILFGGGLVCFGLSHWLWLSMLLMVLSGYGMLRGATASNTILQTLVDEKMRGRVMSYYSMAFVGMTPFGSLLAGVLARIMGAQDAVIVSGAACLLAGGWFLTRASRVRAAMRPVYQQLGIVPMDETTRP